MPHKFDGARADCGSSWHDNRSALPMGLAKYKEKRSFNRTPEPIGGKSRGGSLRFVVQKHAASHLHYDFRLEMEGVLKSWAVPKGPSINPDDKRLAMMVEDHPYDYRTFEGIIPAGNYGAGTVIVWDEGTYEPFEPTGDKRKDDKLLRSQLHKGTVKFRLHGTKLKGEFTLVKTAQRGENAWLLIKHRDKYAKDIDITKKDKSVVSNLTLDEVAASSTNVYDQSEKVTQKSKLVKDKKTTAPKKPTANSREKKALVTRSRDIKETTLSEIGDRAPFPKRIEPMLATLVDHPVEADGWLYEIKWDGYRATAHCNQGEVQLLSRNNKSFNEKYYPLHNELLTWGPDAVLDGEICVLNDKEVAHFGSLQNWRSEADGDLVYYVFDLLWFNGKSLLEVPLEQRRRLLQSIMPDSDIIRYSEAFETSATEFLEAAGKMGMEGIMAKKAGSFYIPGDRSRDWLKIKANKRHEVVIGGFTNNEGSPKAFSALLVGVYEKSKLIYTGKIGTGFNERSQREMLKMFKPLVQKNCPFTEEPDVNKPSRFRHNPPHAAVTWLKPALVCEVSYAEITEDGVMRHPSFEGMRTDKPAKKVVAEKAEEIGKMLPREESKKTKGLLRPAKNTSRNSLLNPSEETQIKKVSGHELTFSNLSKVYWPKEGYTKRDMLNYYYQTAEYMLPYLINRPQSLNRFPNGITGKSFYQKDITGKAPDWIKQFPYHTSDDEDKNFLVPEDEAAILYMANLGAIEMNPWNSTIQNPDYPDWCMIDLDPDAGNTFEQVIYTAQTVKEVLDELKVPCYPKTSGSTGIHIYIPLGAQYTYDECQLFGKIVAMQVHERLPRFTSIERMTRNRKGKIYVDYLQNRPKATLAAPYSLRPKPGATVSMPLHWEEVKKGLQMKDFTIKNAIARIKSEGDLFKPVLGKGIDLAKMLKQFSD